MGQAHVAPILVGKYLWMREGGREGERERGREGERERGYQTIQIYYRESLGHNTLL